MPTDDWQNVVAEQLRTTKAHYDQGKIRAIYRETGSGVLAIYEVADPREMDQLVAGMPLGRYFAEVSVNALWDMGPTLQGL